MVTPTLSGEEIPPNTPSKPVLTQIEASFHLSLSLVAAPCCQGLAESEEVPLDLLSTADSARPGLGSPSSFLSP